MTIALSGLSTCSASAPILYIARARTARAILPIFLFLHILFVFFLFLSYSCCFFLLISGLFYLANNSISFPTLLFYHCFIFTIFFLCTFPFLLPNLFYTLLFLILSIKHCLFSSRNIFSLFLYTILFHRFYICLYIVFNIQYFLTRIALFIFTKFNVL